ncbi:MAG TPA: hypothetical protein VG317_22355 [Pseudonocardiaceae bacterium]|jgi:uncharacterized membrane protein YhaH (DUF805 family)|nr:hypothetical protein [Pseudonocardiaceae bacterium]
MNDSTTTTAANIAGGTLAVILIIGAVVFVALLIAYITIIRKAGYSGWWVLLMFVPLVNVIMLFVFAFSEWPVVREARQFRAQFGGGQPGYGPGPGYPPPPPGYPQS